MNNQERCWMYKRLDGKGAINSSFISGVNDFIKEIKMFYFGEFKKAFYWDSSIDTIVKKQWERKAALRYSDFVSKIKGKKVRLDHIPDNVLNSWKILWADQKSIEKSEINAKNRRGQGSESAIGTHTGGSVTVGEHRKRLAVEKGRDPTPSEMHLHVHTHDHDGKSFVGNRSRIIHEKYKEILKNQTQTHSDIDQYQAYYQAVGGEQKKRIYGLGSQAKCYYGSKFGNTSSSDVSPSTVPSNAQSTVIKNMKELVALLVPTLTEHMLPGLAERVGEVISSTSHHPRTITNQPLNVSLTVPAPAIANVDEVHASNSDNDRNSPASH